jgi:hypothetical protein
MPTVRKTMIVKEVISSEMGKVLATPVTRVAGIAIFSNPLAGRFSNDLSALFEAGRDIGNTLAEALTAEFSRSIVSYDKAAVVGLNGEMKPGGACSHPMLGKPMREAVGGGKSVIPSNVKIGTPATTIDVPLGHKDEAWSFDHFDTMTVSVADAPKPDEIVVVLAFADGGRLIPRCGTCLI